jgi:hypothetical protein
MPRIKVALLIYKPLSDNQDQQDKILLVERPDGSMSIPTVQVGDYQGIKECIDHLVNPHMEIEETEPIGIYEDMDIEIHDIYIVYLCEVKIKATIPCNYKWITGKSVSFQYRHIDQNSREIIEML